MPEVIIESVSFFPETEFALLTETAQELTKVYLGLLAHTPVPEKAVKVWLRRREALAIFEPLPSINGAYAFVYHTWERGAKIRVRPILVIEQANTDVATLRANLIPAADVVLRRVRQNLLRH